MAIRAVPATKATILIVEDVVLAAICLRDEFEDAGYHVMDLTTRHQEALSAALAERPDIALVNIQLQGRDDGISLARDLRAIGVPVVFISGQVSRARSEHTMAIASLPKPYDPADMVLSVAYLLQRLKGDDSLPKPEGLEVFEVAEDLKSRQAV